MNCVCKTCSSKMTCMYYGLECGRIRCVGCVGREECIDTDELYSEIDIAKSINLCSKHEVSYPKEWKDNMLKAGSYKKNE